ncbi:MAG: nitroreductase family protein [Spirochaetales bacterium]|nr:nitroreductase family protein [Spirochaetales bacterium]
MDLFTAIEKRHSYRGDFRDIPIPRKDLERIVDAGIRAPSGRNEQTTAFVIVDDESRLRDLAGIVKKPVVSSAKAVIACIVEHRPVYKGISFAVEDCAAATENMLLAITALGYASVWIDGNIRVDGKAEKLKRLLRLPDNREVRVILPLGVPVESCAQKEKKPFEERAWYNEYGGEE